MSARRVSISVLVSVSESAGRTLPINATSPRIIRDGDSDDVDDERKFVIFDYDGDRFSDSIEEITLQFSRRRVPAKYPNAI